MKATTLLWGLAAIILGCSIPEARADAWKVVPSIAVEQKYSDNIFFDAENTESDFINTLSPALEFSEKTERLTASLKAQLDSLTYFDNSYLNATDQNYRGSLRYAVTQKANVFTSAGFRKDSQVDRDLGETGLLQEGGTRKNYTYEAGADYALSESMGMRLAFNGSQDDYDDPAEYDLESQGVSFVLSRDLSAFMTATTGRLSGTYNEYDQTNEQVGNFFGGTLSTDSTYKVKNYSGSIGAERQWDEKFSLFADVGWRYTDTTQESVQVYYFASPPLVFAETRESNGSGFTGQFGGSYRGETTDANLTLSQEVSAASGTNGATDRTIFRGTVGRRLTEKTRVDVMAEYYINTSVQDEVRPGSNVDEKTLRFNPRLGYQFNQDFSLEVAYMFEQVDDQANDSVSERNVVWCRLVYQYPLFE
ncbi:MAG: outer membrane beta-barrel protein [Desulfobulbaceae bacterium]|nr:outer membrane beta-barrel protein [Desulfobulbaceae bacterium]